MSSLENLKNVVAYNEQLLVQPLPDRYKCPICLSLVIDPVEHTTCDQVFCRKCLKTLRCPMCRNQTNQSNVKGLNRHLKVDYDKIEIKCTNMERGCTAISTLGTFDDHISKCPFGNVCCNNAGCQATILRKDLQQHQAICPFRLVLCPHGCGRMFCENQRGNHYKSCRKFPITCDYCSMVYPRCDQSYHLLRCLKCPCTCASCKTTVIRELLTHHEKAECPKRPIPCRMCATIVPLDEIQQHEEMCPSALIPCEYCSTDHERGKIAIHFTQCPEIKFQCSECECKVTRKDLAKHQNETCSRVYAPCFICNKTVRIQEHRKCPNEVLHCRFCSISLVRHDLHNHLEVCSQKVIVCPVPDCNYSCKREEMENHWSAMSVDHIKTLVRMLQLPATQNDKVKEEPSLPPVAISFTPCDEPPSYKIWIDRSSNNTKVSDTTSSITTKISEPPPYTDVIVRYGRKYGKLDNVWYDCEFAWPLKCCIKCNYVFVFPNSSTNSFTPGFHGFELGSSAPETFNCSRCNGDLSANSIRDFSNLLEEKEAVKRALQTIPAERSIWHPIAMSWFVKWKMYVDYDDALPNPRDPKEVENLHPGPIDNTPLQGSYGDELSRAVVEGQDFVLLPKVTGDRLFQKYNGGPQYPRETINLVSLCPPLVQVNLYPTRLEIYHCDRTHPTPNKELKTHFIIRYLAKNVILDNVIHHLKIKLKIPSNYQSRCWIKDSEDTPMTNDSNEHGGRMLTADVVERDGNWRYSQSLNKSLEHFLGNKDCIEIIVESAPRACKEHEWPRFDLLHAWKSDLQVGDMVDGQDRRKHWYEAVIKDIDTTTGNIHIHFKGWGAEFDEVILPDQRATRIKPLHS